MIRLQRHRLDRVLAGGSDPDGDRHLRHRARKITGAGFRHRLAERLECLVRDADGSPPWQSPVRWAEVRASSILILVLAESLRAPIVVSPQGVARAVLLLDDGAGALYRGGAAEGALAVAAKSALRSLELGPVLSCDRAGRATDVVPPLPIPWGI